MSSILSRMSFILSRIKMIYELQVYVLLFSPTAEFAYIWTVNRCNWTFFCTNN
jgi:hypothetical protein